MLEEVRFRQPPRSPHVTQRLFDVNSVPIDDCRNHKIERHCTLLLSVIRLIYYSVLGMGKDSFRQTMMRLALVQPGLVVFSQLQVFYPVEHEECALNPANSTKGQTQSVLLSIRDSKLRHPIHEKINSEII